MAKAIMIQGTSSNAGKTLITAGLCRIFAQDGYRVSPFKAQNMALNSYITEDGLEMGRAQVVQAEAAYRKPDIRMNPILLKPGSNEHTQVIINGEVLGNMDAFEYYKKKRSFLPVIMKAYDSLSEENDIIVIEGAGSSAEINLKENDIENMGMAKMAKAPVLIVGDIDRGGVFAALYGTYMLQEEEEKKHIKGMIINKFRGDGSILEPGLEMLENLISVPTLGIVPYMEVKIDDEDSISEVLDNIIPDKKMDIAILRLPRISNFTDFNPFENILGSKVRYISNIHEFGSPDLIIIPGSKNTMGDLKWLRKTGLEAEIIKSHNEGTPIFGICGGFQMLCKKLKDPYCVEEGGEMRGIGFFEAETVFEREKTRTRVNGIFEKVDGIFSGLTGKTFEGYEIHMGVTISDQMLNNSAKLMTFDKKTKYDGLAKNNVYGTYVHGIFNSVEVLAVIAKSIYEKKGLDYSDSKMVDMLTFKEKEYDKLADELRRTLDLKSIYRIIDKGSGE